MAKNAVFPYTESQTEVWTLDKVTASGTPVVQNSRPAVTLVGTEGATTSLQVGPVTISGIPRAGASLEGLEATVCTDGTWEFPVDGANGTQAQNTPVFATVTEGESAVELTLTATEGSTVPFGTVNLPRGYAFHGNVLPVKIGVTA